MYMHPIIKCNSFPTRIYLKIAHLGVERGGIVAIRVFWKTKAEENENFNYFK